MSLINKIDKYLVEKTVTITTQGKGETKEYRLMKPDGSELVDMFFDSREKAIKYAKKKGWKIK